MSSCQCMNSHYEDKTGSRPFYFHDGNPYVWEDGLDIETTSPGPPHAAKHKWFKHSVQKYAFWIVIYTNDPTKIWWRHQMATFSTLLAFCEGNPSVTGRFPSQRPVTRSFDVLFDLRLNKRFSKQSRRRWFETPLSVTNDVTVMISLDHSFNYIVMSLLFHSEFQSSRDTVDLARV